MELEPEEVQEGAPEWIVTFADLMSLLLTFFVLLLSFSTTEAAKFREAMGSIREAFGLMSENEQSTVQAGKSPRKDELTDIGAGKTPEEMEQQLQAMLEAFGLEEHGEAQMTSYGAVLRLKGDLMFHSGSSDLSSDTFALLNGLAKYIASGESRVDIVGHTDNIPIATAVYPSNWELSAARAGQAVRHLVEHGVPPENVRAIGQAETVPIDTNDTPEGRARNRRVEFVFSAGDIGDLPAASLEEFPIAARQKPAGE